MDRREIAQLLVEASAIDNRVLDDDGMMVAAWHSAIGHVSLVDARQALAMHRAESTEYLQPAHIAAGVRRVVAERFKGHGLAASAPRGNAPRPLNMAAMAAAWDDEAAYLVQEDIYNEQLAAAGLPPVSGTWRGGRDSVRRRI